MEPESERYGVVLARIQELWNHYKVCSNIEVILTDCFTIAENPYGAALYLLANNETYRYSRKTSFSLFVMKAFETWLQDKGDLSVYLDKEMKLRAFTAVNEQKQCQLIKKIVDIYQLKSDKSIFLPYIWELISSQKYKQACQAATLLELHDSFAIKDFLVPLLLQEKLSIVEEFLEGSPKHQKNILVFLDNMLEEKNIFEKMKHIAEELKVDDARLHRFNLKYINKLIGRYLKEFNQSPELCPNYKFQQKKKALNFVMWKKYIDKSLEGDSWSEMLLEIVQDSPNLQYEMINSLISYLDDDEAYRWFIHFELDEERLPARLKNLIQKEKEMAVNKDEIRKSVPEREWDPTPDHLMPRVQCEENWDEDDDWNKPLYSVPPTSTLPLMPPSRSPIISPLYSGDFEMQTSTGCASLDVPFKKWNNSEEEEFPVECQYDEDQCHIFYTPPKVEEDSEDVENKRTKGQPVLKCMEIVSKAELEFYHLHISDSNIILVDNIETMKELINSSLEGVQMVGLDCEWKPSFYSQKSKVALLQMALWDRVYLIDLIKLNDIPSHIWDDFNKAVFENEDILKLGFDIHADKSMLTETVRQLRGFGSVSFLDLSTLWKTLVNKHHFSFPNRERTSQSGFSLTQLVTLCFGRCLDKSDQFSNWENRPLRKSQKIYAALDAYCLLEIYQFFKMACHKKEIEFNEVVNSIMRGSKSSISKVSKKQRKRNNRNSVSKPEESQEEPKPDYPPCLPHSLKMVCDSMVQGLGRKLRSCGINTWILQNGDDSDVCLKIALRDKRIILTRGVNYYRYIKYVGHEQCFQVREDVLELQVKEVLDHFNVTLREEDIFSRCQICNGDVFVEVHNSLMRRIIRAFSEVPTHSICELSLQDYADGASGFSKNVGRKWEKNNHVKELKNLSDSTFKGVKIKFEKLPLSLFSTVEYFYACDKCGKVYWDGGHWQRELCKKKEANLLKQ